MKSDQETLSDEQMERLPDESVAPSTMPTRLIAADPVRRSSEHRRLATASITDRAGIKADQAAGRQQLGDHLRTALLAVDIDPHRPTFSERFGDVIDSTSPRAAVLKSRLRLHARDSRGG